MEYSLIDLLKLIGSIGLFLYGMKLMSEALQKVAGIKMRSIFAAMTRNRFLGVLTGLLVSATVQSSSATVLMVVSFVNAGLVSLVESIGVVMGANVGTTITGWLISLFGFRFNLTEFALPLMAVGFPLVFSKVNKRKSWGEAIIGFSLLFMSLGLINAAVPDIDSNPGLLRFLSSYTNLGYISVFIFVLIGSLLTVIIQSSGATLAITFVMCNMGWIPYELGAAMILGENLGTTITPNLAATIGNISSKRTARFHFIFNLVGVIWMLSIFGPYTKFVQSIVTSMSGISVKNPQALIPFSLALFHTSFNVINLLLFIGFVPLINRAIIRMVPNHGEDGEEFKLRYITTGMLSTAELCILQAKKELQSFAKHNEKMLGFNRRLLSETNEKNFRKMYSAIEKYAAVSDDVEEEVAGYLAKVSKGKLTDQNRKNIRSMLKLVSDLENIGETSFNIARIMNKMQRNHIVFSSVMMKKLNAMFGIVEESIAVMRKSLSVDEKKVDLNKAKKITLQIHQYYRRLRDMHTDSDDNSHYLHGESESLIEILLECDKIASSAMNVSEALYQAKG